MQCAAQITNSGTKPTKTASRWRDARRVVGWTSDATPAYISTGIFVSRYQGALSVLTPPPSLPTHGAIRALPSTPPPRREDRGLALQTTQAYQVTYDYGKEGALVDALLGGDVPERRTPRKANQAQVAALPDDDDDDGSFGESDDDEAEQQLQQIQQKVFSPEKAPSPVPEPSPVQEPDVPDELRQKRQQVKNYQVMLEALARCPT